MMPKDFQEKVLDACAVAWDGTSEAGAGELYENVRIQIKNLAKARREMQGPTGSQTRGRTGRKIGTEVGGTWKR